MFQFIQPLSSFDNNRLKTDMNIHHKKRSKNEVILQKSRKLTTSVNNPICPMKGNIQVIFVLH